MSQAPDHRQIGVRAASAAPHGTALPYWGTNPPAEPGCSHQPRSVCPLRPMRQRAADFL